MLQRLIVTCSALCLCSATAIAQIPEQKVKDPSATQEAGIAFYELIRAYDQENLPGVLYSVTVEALDKERQPLASCEVEWLEDSKVMTCTLADGGRFQANWYPDWAEFADLRTGDQISLRKEGVPAMDSAYLDATKSRLEHGEWIVRGAKTMEEAEHDWGHITPIFGHLLAEVEITVGMIPGDRLFLDRRIRQSKELNQPGLPLKFDPCNGGPSYCDSSDVCMISGVFADTRSRCCAEASRRADTCCKSFTLLDCCANSVCNSVCPLGLFCECFLDGWKKKCGTHPSCPPPPFE